MRLPQPSALDEKDLLTVVRKTCSGDVEDHSERSCPPPRCSTDDCMKELGEKDVANELANVVGTYDQSVEVKAPDQEDYGNEGQDREDGDKFGRNLDGKPES